MSQKNKYYKEKGPADKTSWIVAIFAILLILAGIFLLNKQFSKPKDEEEVVKTNTTSQDDNTNDSNSEGEGDDVTDTDYPVENEEGQEGDTADEVATDDTSDSDANPVDSGTDTEETVDDQDTTQTDTDEDEDTGSDSGDVTADEGLKSGKTEAELIAKVTEIDAESELIKYTVVETGFTDTRWLQVGAWFYLDDSNYGDGTPEVGQKHKIELVITDSQEPPFEIEQVVAVSLVD